MHDDTSTRAEFGYFTSLTIENVRCFAQAQKLVLHGEDGVPAKWTVILGNNGVGKTTVLQCLVAMEPVVVEEPRPGAWEGTNPRGLSWIFTPAPRINTFTRRAGIPVRLTASLTFGVPMNASGPEMTLGLESHNEGHSGSGQVAAPEVNVLLCAYGASRKPGSSQLAGHVSARTETLFDESARLLSADEWLLQNDYAARSALPGDSRAQQRFQRIRTTLVDLLEDVSDLRVVGLDSDPPSPRVEASTPYGWVAVRDLSLGYRTLMAWVVDLAARMFAHYPDSANPLAEPAICLVDEIDLHLHPRWQRKVIGYLDERFPRTQFIVTAHSPLVVQAAHGANIAVLERHERDDFVTIHNDHESVHGWRVDQILISELFGLPGSRSPEVDELLRKRTRILGQDELSEADRVELRRLDEQLAELPEGETVADQDAWDVVRRFAAILRRDGATGE